MERKTTQAYLDRSDTASRLGLAYKRKALDHVSRLLDGLFDQAWDNLIALSEEPGSPTLPGHRLQDTIDTIRLQRPRICTAFIADLGNAISYGQALPGAHTLALDDSEPARFLHEAAVRADSRLQAAAEGHADRVNVMNEQRSLSISPAALLPGHLCATFAAAVTVLDLRPETETMLYRLFDRHVLTHLDSVYQDLDELLAEHGIVTGRAKREGGAQMDTALLAGEDIPWTRHVQRVHTSISPEHVFAIGEIWEALNHLDSSDSQPYRPGTLVKSVRQHLRSNQADAMPRSLDPQDRRLLVLVDALLEDALQVPEIAASSRKLIQRLALPLTKTALLAPEALWRPDQPARALINDLAALDETASENQDFVRAGNQLIDHLLARFDEEPAVIETAAQQIAGLCAKAENELDDSRRLSGAQRRCLLELRQQTLDRQLPDSILGFLTYGWTPYLAVQHIRHGRDSDQWRDAIWFTCQILDAAQPLAADSDAGTRRQRQAQLLQQTRARLPDLKLASGRLADLTDRLESAFQDALRLPLADPAEQPAPLTGLQQQGAIVFDDTGEHDAAGSLFEQTVARALGLNQAEPPRPAAAPAPEPQPEIGPGTQQTERFLEFACKPDTWFQFHDGDRPTWSKVSRYDKAAGVIHFKYRKGTVEFARDADDFLEDLLAERVLPIYDQDTFTARLEALTRRSREANPPRPDSNAGGDTVSHSEDGGGPSAPVDGE